MVGAADRVRVTDAVTDAVTGAVTGGVTDGVTDGVTGPDVRDREHDAVTRSATVPSCVGAFEHADFG